MRAPIGCHTALGDDERRVDAASSLLWSIPVALLSVFLGRLASWNVLMTILLVGALGVGVLVLSKKCSSSSLSHS